MTPKNILYLHCTFKMVCALQVDYLPAIATPCFAGCCVFGPQIKENFKLVFFNLLCWLSVCNYYNSQSTWLLLVNWVFTQETQGLIFEYPPLRALVRPGRFDTKITVPMPDVKGRHDILKLHLKNVQVADGMCILPISDNEKELCYGPGSKGG